MTAPRRKKEQLDIFSRRRLPPAAARTSPPLVKKMAEDLEESGRRRTQIWAVLARLRQGPALNTELQRLTLRLGARIYDLRGLGYEISVRRLGGSGLCEYALEKEPE